MGRRIASLLLGLATIGGCTPRTGAVTQPPDRSVAPPTAAAPPTTPPQPTSAAAPDRLAGWTIPARPPWTDRYADEVVGDGRFFNVSALMQDHGLSRALAVELQNHFRDLSRAEPNGDAGAHFDAALEKAKNEAYEGRRDVERIAKASFVVVFDLDDTLYDQSIDAKLPPACADLVVVDGSKQRRIKLTPGANAALDRIAALGGAVVIFTAAPDDRSLANLRAWQFGGKPLPEHPAISGVLTNSHLVLQDKREGEGASNPKAGRPVVEPAKDLRIFDESLERVILVDDNPLRTFQPRNLRLVKKFDGDTYCTTTDAKLKKAFEQTLPEVVTEIEDSVRWAKQNKVSFATAFLPYSQLGRVAVDFLRGAGMSERAAIVHLRTHPEIVDRDF
jgi:hypothetical protein